MLLPPPPHDLIAACMECTPFRAPDNSVRVPISPSNSHYHLHMECLTSADPGFNSLSMVLPDDIKDKLRIEHKEFLSTAFVFLHSLIVSHVYLACVLINTRSYYVDTRNYYVA